MPGLDLVIVMSFTLLQMLLVLLDIAGPIRAGSGFLFVSLWPGYSFLAAFYRLYRQNLMGILEHVVLSVPISLALNVVLGLVLNNLNLSIRPEAHVLWMGFLTCALALVAMVHPHTDHGNKLRYSLAFIGALTVALLLGVFVHSIILSDKESYLSLYVLGADGQAVDYPIEVAAGTPVQITIGVNYGGTSVEDFHLVSPIEGEIALSVQPGDEWEKNVELTLTQPGLHRVSWDLYRSGMNVPARSVHLWLKVY
jgi:uncharacterized membrane protein